MWLIMEPWVPMDAVAIVIPTLDRPAPLRRALLSALTQQGLDDLPLEIVVVDNSRDGSARRMIDDLPEAPGRLIRYLSLPVPGVASARNAGVAAAGGRWIAFLDDDQEASPLWIASHLAVLRATGADAVFGPVEALPDSPGEIGGFAPYFSRTIDRPDAADVTDLGAYLGTNNSMFERARCLDEAAPFDPTLDQTGGEDSLLIRRLVLSGRRFAFAASARVIEWVPPRRLNWAYVRKRKFLSGQIRSFVNLKVSPARWGDTLIWMAVGAAQFALAGLAAALFAPFDHERSSRALASAYGGLGKLLWMPRFRPALYGSGHVS